MERFGRYRVTGTLGKGAMGDVYLAVDEVLGREVAVKTLKGGASGLAARLLDERFRQEARAIASLAHPGVVQVFDIDVNADPPYLVMERMTGKSLKERLADGVLSDRELRALGIQIANALVAAHAAGIVHRDVKPANILAAADGQWKLADFGVAHVPDSSLTMTGQFVGSPAYAPPEALMRGQLGPAGDIYGLGATLYQAIAGRWPRADAEETRALFAPVPPLAQLVPNVSPAIADVIDRAVAMEPDQRPSASELAAGLARAPSQPVAASPSIATPVPGSIATPVPGSIATPVPGSSTTPVLSPSIATPAPAPSAQTEFVASTPGAPNAQFAASGAPNTQFVASTAGAPHTQFVASTPGAPTTPDPNTHFVASMPGAPNAHFIASMPGASAVTLPGTLPPPATAKRDWRKYAFLGAVVLVIVIIAVTRQSPSPPAARTTSFDKPTSSLPEPQPMGPHTIQAKTPPINDHKAAKDWNKIVDKLYDQDWGEARKKLHEFERKHGSSEETRDLAEQLDRLPRELMRYEDDD